MKISYFWFFSSDFVRDFVIGMWVSLVWICGSANVMLLDFWRSSDVV